jgi:predicted transcriptional regulator
MAKSMNEYLDREMQCEGLLECVHGLGDLDRQIFTVIAEREDPMTVDEVAEEVDRERSTAYRSVQRLLESGFVQAEQINYDQGGYYHVYRARDPDLVADEMQRMLNDWYAKMGQLIVEFRDTYEDVHVDQPTPES